MKEALPALILDKVNVYYTKRRFFKKGQKKHVLKDVSFTVRQGESVGIIGRNGAGKTSLLRVLAGTFPPDSGTVTNCGLSVALLSFGGGVFPECSAWDNAVILLMLQQNLALNDAVALVPKIAAFAELEHAIHNPIKTFSSGMLARFNFAVSTQARPDILLVDEVLAVGDMLFTYKCYAALTERLERQDTVIFVSHSVVDIANRFSRVIWLEEGVVMADGPAKSVVEQYQQFCKELSATKQSELMQRVSPS